MSIIRNDQGRPLYPVGSTSFVDEATITAGTTPIVLDVESVLKFKGNRGYIANDNPAGGFSLLVEIAHVAGAYLTQFTLKAGEVFDLTGWDVSEIRLTRSGGDCTFRVHAW